MSTCCRKKSFKIHNICIYVGLSYKLGMDVESLTKPEILFGQKNQISQTVIYRSILVQSKFFMPFVLGFIKDYKNCTFNTDIFIFQWGKKKSFLYQSVLLNVTWQPDKRVLSLTVTSARQNGGVTCSTLKNRFTQMLEKHTSVAFV